MSRLVSAVPTPCQALHALVCDHGPFMAGQSAPCSATVAEWSNPITSFKDAVERARRIEVARAAGAASGSAMPFAPVINHVVVGQFQSTRHQDKQREHLPHDCGRNGHKTTTVQPPAEVAPPMHLRWV
ncbi:MAG: hypothetical protein ABJQ70_14820 [Roseobacter sp.]